MWPSAAEVLAGQVDVTTQPPAERTDIDDAGGDQVDRATAPRELWAVQWWMPSSADAVTWIEWANSNAHRWFDAPGHIPGRARIVGGMAGVTLTAHARPGQPPDWTGAATFEVAP